MKSCFVVGCLYYGVGEVGAVDRRRERRGGERVFFFEGEVL